VRAEVPERVIAPAQWWRGSWVRAAAALVVVALGLSFWLWNRETPPTTLARLTDVSEPVWADEATAPAVGAALGRQVLTLRSGAAQIRFASGVVLTLTGPAELELQNAKQVALRRGGVSLYVPPAGHGFTVTAPNGKFVDLGTEFSLDVDDQGRSDVHVLDGAVRMEPDPRRHSANTELIAGYSARLETNALAYITQTPLLIDRFGMPDGAAVNTDLPRRQAGGRIVAEYRDLTPAPATKILNGMLALAVRGQLADRDVLPRVVLARDFRELIGRRYTIAFRALLPHMGSGYKDCWAACVLWDGAGADSLPLAFETATPLAVLLSPQWQVAVRLRGHGWPRNESNLHVFQREQAAGPYQVVLNMDETGAGGPQADLTVNGVKILSGRPLRLADHRYLGFHTYAQRIAGAEGWAGISDLRISLAPETQPASHANAGKINQR
jgi:hypothetical protein